MTSPSFAFTRSVMSVSMPDGPQHLWSLLYTWGEQRALLSSQISRYRVVVPFHDWLDPVVETLRTAKGYTRIAVTAGGLRRGVLAGVEIGRRLHCQPAPVSGFHRSLRDAADNNRSEFAIRASAVTTWSAPRDFTTLLPQPRCDSPLRKGPRAQRCRLRTPCDTPKRK
jgi:hypothetical protein